MVTSKCKLCYQEFLGLQAVPQQRDTQHGFRVKTANVELDDNKNEVNDMNLNEELRSCQFFFVGKARDKVFNYAVDYLKESVVNEQLYQLFNNF